MRWRGGGISDNVTGGFYSSLLNAVSLAAANIIG